MMELLKRNSATKIISLLFAMLLWFYVMDTSNPINTFDMNVPLKIENESSLIKRGIVMKSKNFPRNIVVSLKGRKVNTNSINANDVEAILDLSKVKDASEKTLPIDVYINKEGISYEGASPKGANLDLEPIGENPFDVKVVIVGKPKENYKVVKTNAIPDTVSIRESDSVIKSIGEVKVFVDVTNMDRDIVIKKECKVYNKNKLEIPELGKNLLEKNGMVDVEVDIAKEVPIIPLVKGKPAKDYVDGMRSVKPEKALIDGTPEVLKNISEIRTQVLDIGNLNESVNVKCLLDLPQGVSLVKTPRSVDVSVVIEQLAVKDYVIDKNDITIVNTKADNTMGYEIIPDTISIRVKGNREDIDRLSPRSFKPNVDVEGLAEGTHKRWLNISLPGTVNMIHDVEVMIKVSKISETGTEGT